MCWWRWSTLHAMPLSDGGGAARGRPAAPVEGLARVRAAAAALLSSDGSAEACNHFAVYVEGLSCVQVAAGGHGTPCPRATAPPWAAAAPWVSSQTCPACESLLEDTARPCSGATAPPQPTANHGARRGSDLRCLACGPPLAGSARPCSRAATSSWLALRSPLARASRPCSRFTASPRLGAALGASTARPARRTPLGGTARLVADPSCELIATGGRRPALRRCDGTVAACGPLAGFAEDVTYVRVAVGVNCSPYSGATAPSGRTATPERSRGPGSSASDRWGVPPALPGSSGAVTPDGLTRQRCCDGDEARACGRLAEPVVGLLCVWAAVGGDGTALLTRDGVIVACRRFGVPVDDLSYALAAAGWCRPPCLVHGCGAPLERAARPYSEVTAPP